jgi:hypothetical protein
MDVWFSLVRHLSRSSLISFLNKTKTFWATLVIISAVIATSGWSPGEDVDVKSGLEEFISSIY